MNSRPERNLKNSYQGAMDFSLREETGYRCYILPCWLERGYRVYKIGIRVNDESNKNQSLL